MPKTPTISPSDEMHLDRLQRLASLGTITAILAHEVNNVLTPVLSHAQFALQDMDNHDRLIAAAGRAAAGAKQAAQIIDGVLRLARGEPANEQPHADVREAITTAIACLARDPSKDGIRVRVEAPEEPVAAAIAPTWLLQCLLNLILNARNAMAGKGGSLAIRVSRSTWNSDAGGGVEISIADTGPGIPQDVIDRLFEPFAHSQHEGCAHCAKQQGVGLGLTVTRQIIETAGGSIGVKSEPGRGSTFTISLPASTRSKIEQKAA